MDIFLLIARQLLGLKQPTIRGKLICFLLLLPLAAMSCANQPEPRTGGIGSAEIIDFDPGPTSIPVVTFSATSTFTAIPPTETYTLTPVPPTSPPITLDPVAKVTGQYGVNVRVGPCNQPEIVTAPYGAEMPVTGWYRTPNGFIWWRVKLTSTSGTVYEGWVYGGLVEVTNATGLPFVASQCPAFDATSSNPEPTAMIIPATTVSPVVLPACQTKTDGLLGIEGGIQLWVWPRLVQGDPEFDGNGPYVNVKVILAHNEHEAVLRIFMRAAETEPDWTTAQDDTGWHQVYQAPSGWRIQSMNLSRVDEATGVHFSEWSYSYTDDDHDLEIFEPQDGSPINHIAVKGDTDGNDIGVQWDLDSTHAVASLHNPLTVELIQEGNCQ